MRAEVGDRLHVHGRVVGTPDQTSEIIEIRGPDGAPPYLVRRDDGHEVLAGCVHNPVSGETWTATPGGGAWLDGRPIRCTDVGDLAQALLATGFGYQASRRSHQASVVAALLPQVRDIRRMGSGALDLCQVACGRVDGYLERGLHPWDLAAGALIAREAGAVVSGLGQAAAGYELVLAAGPRAHALLQAAVSGLGPDTDGP